ncbi:uncharacterized protein LOC129961754 [Argiope bruennichi]|nr:uncharacterized protein LOC129961754 [Argiope bruennichi]
MQSSFIAVLLIISTLYWTSEGLRCREACFQRCIKTLTRLIEDEYDFQIHNGTESEEVDYCLKMVEACIEDAFEDCEEDHHIMAAMSVTLFNRMNEGCSSDTDTKNYFTEIFPCLRKNTEMLKDCSTENPFRRHKLEYPVHKLATVCTDMKSMMCIAEKSREMCSSNMSLLAGAVEYSLKHSYYGMCSGSLNFFHNNWIFAVSIFTTLLFSQKMKHWNSL